MSTRPFTQADLEAYLDEGLGAAEMAEVEQQLRERPELLERLQAILARRDAGVHTLGEIWRQHRISCPEREILGSYLLGVLDPAQGEYLRFHLEQIGCRFCQANLRDLQARQQEVEAADQAATTRRQRYFQSSAGYLRRP